MGALSGSCLLLQLRAGLRRRFLSQQLMLLLPLLARHPPAHPPTHPPTLLLLQAAFMEGGIMPSLLPLLHDEHPTVQTKALMAIRCLAPQCGC